MGNGGKLEEDKRNNKKKNIFKINDFYSQIVLELTFHSYMFYPTVLIYFLLRAASLGEAYHELLPVEVECSAHKFTMYK